jgi:hypothetical protein
MSEGEESDTETAHKGLAGYLFGFGMGVIVGPEFVDLFGIIPTLLLGLVLLLLAYVEDKRSERRVSA